MPDSGQFFEFTKAYLSRRPWASEATSHKVVAATFRLPQCDHTVGKLSADAGLLCSEA